MTVGTHCYIRQVSADSMALYAKYRRRGAKLVCACNISQCDELKVTDVLGNGIVLVSQIAHPTLLTLIYEKDLIKV